FQVLPGARHRLAVVYNGATWQSEVLQAAQQPLTVLNTLPLELLLLDSGGLPIDDARVELHRASGGHVTTTRTGNDGVAGFEVLPGATMLLEAEYNGAAYRTEPVLVEQPEQLAVSTLSFSLLLGDSQGQPITDVRVNLRQGSGGYIANTRTGEDGEAGFEVLPGATVLLEADYHGDTYRTAAVQVTQDTQLGLQTLPLQLLLVDSQGQPIADVRVNLRRASGSYVANALTGEDGVASFEVLPGAEMLLEADLLGTTSRTAAVTVDQATQLQLQTLSSGLLLLDSQGSPIADVAVELQRSNGSRLATTRTGEDGVAAFELLPGATMRLEADLLGKAFRSAVTTITENTRLQVQTAAISVLLTRAGAPIASQPVDLLPASGNGRLLYLRTSDEGLVTFEVLPGTTYRVRASYNGVTWTSERLTAPAEVMRSF
ncbi:MAG: hypothetical protein FJ125_12880, partial [Deltaproteobacteria bacterium]|nr:hypothetical protein [Deltaproteobacteria bacterium]